MTSNDRTAPNGPVFDDTLTPASTVTIPEKVALSNTTTAYEPGRDRTPRTSKDSVARSNPFETDIEAMEIIDSKPCTSSRGLTPNNRKDDQVWPGKDHWRQRAKSAKVKKRSCTCLAKMSRRNRIMTKILLAILIVGIAVAVGFGVSKPLGAPIWGDD